jgi:hypothetical protein
VLSRNFRQTGELVNCRIEEQVSKKGITNELALSSERKDVLGAHRNEEDRALNKIL